MGLGDVVSNALIRVKADTSQAKAELRSLRGEERKAAQERLGELEKQNSGIDKQIAMWGKAALAVGAGVAAFKIAKDAANAYLEDVRLQSAAAGANLDRLKMATQGLVEADKLLEFAGKAQHGTWKLNQEEMDRVLRGAMALRAQFGGELEPTIEKLTESISKGSTKSLREFGIEAKDKVGVLKELDAIAASVGGNAALMGDEFKRSEVALADSLDDLKGSLGELVIALAPVIEGLAGAVGLLNDAITGWKLLFGGESPWEADMLRKNRAHAQSAIDQNMEAQGGLLANELAARGQIWARDNQGSVAFLSQLLAAAGKQPAAAKKAGGGGPAGPGLSLEALSAFGGFSSLGSLPGFASDFGQSAFSSYQTGTAWNAINQQNLAAGGAKTPLAEGQAAIQKMLEQWELLDAKRKENGNLLATIFGTSAEMNETIASIKLASSAFGVLTDAAGSAFDAWITGSESLGKAFAKAIAEGLKATAVQMFVESLKHTAFGFGALAFGPIMGATAAAHFKAAAVFGAGAAIAGTSAKLLGQATGQWSGGGGAGASAGGGGAARTIGSSSTREQDNRPINVYVGAEWAAMSKLEQSAAITRAIQLGKRGSRHIRRS